MHMPASLAFDPYGQREENYISRELHYIDSIASRIFVLGKGSFFQKDLYVINEETGLALTLGTDYRLGQINKQAIKECGGQAVYCVLRIVNPTLNVVAVDYRAVGGKHESMLNVVLDLAQYEDTGNVPAIPFHSVIGWPSTVPSAEHTHPWREVVGLQRLFNAIYELLIQLYRNQHPQYQAVGNLLATAFAGRALIVNQSILDLEERIRRYEQMATLATGDIYITKNINVPSIYLGYGSWIKLSNVMLLGASALEVPGTLIELQAGSNPATDENALKVNFWKRVDDDNALSYTITANKTSVNEGSSVTFTVNGGNARAGLGLIYQLKGITSSDIGGQSLKGTMFLNNSGIGTLTLNLTADNLEEGTESIIFTIDGYPSLSKPVTVNDTSKSIFYETYFSSTADGESPVNLSNEGDTIYLIIKSRNASNNYTLNVRYDGSTATSADFLTAMPTTVNVRSQLASIAYQVKSDKVTEGNERLNVYLCLSGQLSTAVASANVRIIDRSKTPQLRMFFSSDLEGTVEINSIGEAVPFYLHLRATNTEDGTQFNITHTGTFNAGDFTAPLPNILSITNGGAVYQYQTVADVKTEGMEFLRAVLLQNGSAVDSVAIDILDTSNDPDLIFCISGNRFGTNPLNWINEGQSAFIVMLTNLIADGTPLDLVYGGTVNANDFTEELPASLTVNDGGFFHRFTLKEDKLTEGEQFLSITLRDPITSDELATYKLVVKDTSLAPIYSAFLSSDQAGNVPQVEFSEGSVVYAQFRSNDTASVQTHAVDVFIGGNRATAVNGDVTITPFGTVTLVNGRGVLAIRTRADERTEGTEVISVNLRQLPTINSPVIASATGELLDSSKDPVWSVLLSLTELVDTPIVNNQVLEGQTIYLVLNTENVTEGTYFWLGYTQGNSHVSDSDDFLGPLPSFLITTGNRTVVPYTVKQDWTVDVQSPERFVINVYRDSGRTNQILGTAVDIFDPSISLRFSGSSNGSGTITQVNEGDIAYLAISSTYVNPTTVWEILYFIDGIAYEVGDADLVEPLTHQFSFTQPNFVFAIPISPDGIADGRKRLTVQLRGIGQPEELPPMAESFVDMIDTSFGGVTAPGTYRVGVLGTIAVGAGATLNITLVGAGGAGDLRALNGGASAALEGRDGIASILSFSNVAIFTAGGGTKGDVYDRVNGGLGGLGNHNFAYTNALVQFSFRDIVIIDGADVPRDGNFGSVSPVLDGSGAGSIGLVNGTGGGSGSAISFVLENLTSTVQLFGLSIGAGGASQRQGQTFIWNDGCIIIDVEDSA